MAFLFAFERWIIFYISFCNHRYIKTQRTLRIHKIQIYSKTIYVVFRIINHILLSICIHNYLISTICQKNIKSWKRYTAIQKKIATKWKKNRSTSTITSIEWERRHGKRWILLNIFTTLLWKSIMYVLHQPKHSISFV